MKHELCMHSIILADLEIRRMTKSMVVTDKEELSLECAVDGKPYPKVTWRKGRLTGIKKFKNSCICKIVLCN